MALFACGFPDILLDNLYNKYDKVLPGLSRNIRTNKDKAMRHLTSDDCWYLGSAMPAGPEARSRVARPSQTQDVV